MCIVHIKINDSVVPGHQAAIEGEIIITVSNGQPIRFIHCGYFKRRGYDWSCLATCLEQYVAGYYSTIQLQQHHIAVATQLL